MRSINTILATQTAHFRGTSSFDVRVQIPDAHNLRTIDGSVYTLSVTGGVSGTFAAVVVGRVGGSTINLAGITAVTAAGTYVLWPFGYSASGLGTGFTNAVDILHRLDQTVPPVVVALQSVVATVGISAACTISACVRA